MYMCADVSTCTHEKHLVQQHSDVLWRPHQNLQQLLFRHLDETKKIWLLHYRKISMLISQVVTQYLRAALVQEPKQ